MNNAHPIELFLAALINLFEFTCYIINELAGFHKQATAAAEQPTKPNQVSINPLFIQFNQLTIKQLQVLTGIKSSKYRKRDLLFQVAACV